MQIDLCPIEASIEGESISICPVLIRQNGFNLLIDCGYDETLDLLLEALHGLSLSPDQLHAVFITHDDIDHLGSLATLKAINPTIKVYAGEIEAPSVSGDIPAERLLQAKSSLGSLPEAYLPWAKRFIERLEAIHRVPVDVFFADGDRVLDDWLVVHTPGHTKGHVSLFHSQTSICIAGDALVIDHGSFQIANPQFTLDLPGAIHSVRKIQALKPASIICYHGGVMSTDVDQQLTSLLHQYSSV